MVSLRHASSRIAQQASVTFACSSEGCIRGCIALLCGGTMPCVPSMLRANCGIIGCIPEGKLIVTLLPV